MANEITLKTRLLNLYENSSTSNPRFNSNSTNENIKLKKGEILFHEEMVATDNGEVPVVLMKVGDGVATNDQLNVVAARAADVYAWAKEAEKPSYTAEEISGIDTYIKEYVETDLGLSTDTNTTYSFTIPTSGTNKGKLVITPSEGDATILDFVTPSELTTVLADYAKSTDLANYVTSTTFNSYKSSNDTALAGVKATADAAATKTALNDEITRAKAAEKVNADAITAIKDGTTLDSFKDVETALAGKQQTGDYATKAQAQSYANAKDAAIEAAQNKADAAYTLADAARTETEVNSQIDAKITALKLGETYEPIGAESRAKAYADNLIIEANLGQYTTEDEVKTVINKVIADASDGTTYENLVELVDYIDAHGGEAAAMASAIDILEGKVETVEGKPAYDITDTQITNWDNEVGAKALAQSKTTSAEVKAQIEAYKYATTAQVATAKSEAISTAATDATTKANKALTDAQTYADQAEADAIATAAADATTKANTAKSEAISEIKSFYKEGDGITLSDSGVISIADASTGFTFILDANA